MNDKTIKWGVISTANIGASKVVPAMQQCELGKITAIGSANVSRAKEIAQEHGIAKVHDSYDALLANPEIDAVYIPLPNHLHVEWSIKALEAGKHVLCEKPIGLDTKDAQRLIDAAKKYPNLKVMEAFMYRFHPQWIKVKELVADGAIGEVRTIHSIFTYFNDDPQNVRNQSDIGGGGLMDIGCYNISFPRFVFEDEPEKILGVIDRDPELKTDRMTSGVMHFSGNRTSTFTCSTQLMPFQRCIVHGREGLIEIQIPVNAPADEPVQIFLRTKTGEEEYTFEPVDQYTLQADAFAKAILNNTDVPTSLDDALNNMKVIDAIVQSAENDAWVSIV